MSTVSVHSLVSASFARVASIFVVVNMVLGIFFIGQHDAYAIAMLHGGRSMTATPCTCTSGCVIVYVGPPVAGPRMYCPSSTRLYQYYNIWPSAWQLGNGTGFMACLFYMGFGCGPIGGGPLQYLNGTSAY